MDATTGARRGVRAGSSTCAAGAELRCCCGSLLARVVAGGLELKCRRCKHATVLSAADVAQVLQGARPAP